MYRNKLARLLAESKLIDGTLDRERARAERDSKIIAHGVEALRGMVPVALDAATGIVKDRDAKAEALRLEQRKDDETLRLEERADAKDETDREHEMSTLLARLGGQERIAKAREAAKAKAKAPVELDAEEQDIEDGARALRMQGGFDKIKASEASGTPLSKPAQVQQKAEDKASATEAKTNADELRQLATFARNPKTQGLVSDEGWAQLERIGIQKPKAAPASSTSNTPKVSAKEQRAIDAANERKKNTATRGADGLRKEFNALPAVKQYNEVKIAHQKMKDAATRGSPAGDFALIFSLMKAMDPESVVRESEFKAAASAGDFGDQVRASVERVATGERLTPDQRADFLKQAEAFLGAQRSAYDGEAARYRDLAVSRGLEPADVIGGPRGSAPASTTSRADAINKRIGELKRQGVTKEQARDILKREGLIQ